MHHRSSSLPATGYLRIAFVGRGGAGKSVLAATLARAVGRATRRVILVDTCSSHGTCFALGVEPSDRSIPLELCEASVERGLWRLPEGTEPLDVVAEHGIPGPDAVTLLQAPKNEASRERPPLGNYDPRIDPFSELIHGLGEEPVHLIGDQGSPRYGFAGRVDFADTLLIVAEPTMSSALAAKRYEILGRRMKEVPAQLDRFHSPADRLLLVANKVRESGDAEWLASITGLEVAAVVPWEPAIDKAGREGAAPADHAAGTPAIGVMEELASRLLGALRPSEVTSA